MLYQTENAHGGDIYTEPIRLDFSVNTNPLGTPESVIRAMRNAALRASVYPDPFCTELVQGIGTEHQIPASCVLCGNGAAELIYTFCRAVRPSRALLAAPAFSEYEAALLSGTFPDICRVDVYPLKKEQGFQLQEDFLPFVEEHKPEVIFLCNPNNPDGRLIPADLLEETVRLCRKISCRLFLDECFLDLSEDPRSMIGKLQEYPELLILRAFTKNYALAGARLGYCLSSDHTLLGRMAALSQPWNVSVLAQAAGVAALKEKAYLEKARQMIRVEKEWLRKELHRQGFSVYPSEANYLLLEGPEGLEKKLRERGIAIRNCGNFRNLSEGWYRIAIRPHEENEELIRTLKSFFREREGENYGA